MIYGLTYPSGGFGHFLYALITRFGAGFQGPSSNIVFSENGNAHAMPLLIPKSLHGVWEGFPSHGIDFGKHQLILIDHGITNEDDHSEEDLPVEKMIKVVHSEVSWPILAATSLVKATSNNYSSVSEALDDSAWDKDCPFRELEKQTRYLIEHHFRNMWRGSIKNDYCLDIWDLLDFDRLKISLLAAGISIGDDARVLWDFWRPSNSRYIDPVLYALKIVSAIRDNNHIDITTHDNWDRAVIEYFLYINFKFETPYFDFPNWFSSTSTIIQLLKDNRLI